MKQLSVILPATFRLAMAPQELGALPYRMLQVATNNETGEQLWLVESETDEGISSFRAEVSSFAETFEIRKNTKFKGAKTNWTMNAMPDNQDNSDDPIEMLNKARNHFSKVDEVNRSRRSAVSNANSTKQNSL